MAKKILAVVLAVMMAVSAMAISASAVEIQLKPGTTDTYSNEFTATLSVPIANLYGYATQGDYVNFTLPTTELFDSWTLRGHVINYTIVANGIEIALQPSYPTLYKANAAGQLVNKNGNLFAADNGTGDVTGTNWMPYEVDADGNPIDAQGRTLTQGTDGKWYAAVTAVVGGTISYEESAVSCGWDLGEVEVKATPNTVNADKTYTQPVYFDNFYHDYLGTLADGVTYWATIPQSTSVNQYNSLNLVMTVSPNLYTADLDGDGVIDAAAKGAGVANGQWDHTWKLGNELAKLAYGKAWATIVRADYFAATAAGTNAAVAVPQSTSFGYTWTVVDESAGKTNTNAFNFVTDQWDITASTKTAIRFTWDHTLQNTFAVQTAESAEVVITLSEPIVGKATYSLYAKTGTHGSQGAGSWIDYTNDLWWNYNDSRTLVSLVDIDTAVTGPVTELHFPIENLDALYESQLYGTYNTEFVVFENPTLWNERIFNADYVTVNRNTVTGVGTKAGSYGNLSWPDEPSSGVDRVYYAGQPVNYSSNVAFGTVKATNAVLVTNNGDADNVNTPTQGTDNDEDPTEGDEFEVTDNQPEQNPHTGIALAVVPMLVAAAAAVVSKKH